MYSGKTRDRKRINRSEQANVRCIPAGFCGNLPPQYIRLASQIGTSNGVLLPKKPVVSHCENGRFFIHFRHSLPHQILAGIYPDYVEYF
jgi:hypothetical protein